MIQLQTANSRMKDFFDVRYLGQHFEFEGERLSGAIRQTFGRRQTVLSPDGVSELFERLLTRTEKRSQWAGFLRKASPSSDWTFAGCLSSIQTFVAAPLRAAATGEPLQEFWPAGGPWQP